MGWGKEREGVGSNPRITSHLGEAGAPARHQRVTIPTPLARHSPDTPPTSLPTHLYHVTLPTPLTRHSPNTPLTSLSPHTPRSLQTISPDPPTWRSNTVERVHAATIRALPAPHNNHNNHNNHYNHYIHDSRGKRRTSANRHAEAPSRDAGTGAVSVSGWGWLELGRIVGRGRRLWVGQGGHPQARWWMVAPASMASITAPMKSGNRPTFEVSVTHC